MVLTSAPLWLSLGAGGVLLWGARGLLHRGLAPQATLDGLQPEDLSLPAQAVRIPASHGLTLFAWYIPAQVQQAEQDAQCARAAPAVVLLHGWGGNASSLLPAAQTLHKAGYTVLLPESRNHGRSDRDGHSSLPRFAEDLGSALDWLKMQPNVDPARLAALGHSVGGAAVLLSASRRKDLRAAISVSAFSHPEDIMRSWLAARRIPYRPIGWLINRYVEHVIGERFDRIAPVTTLCRISCPVLLVHGRQDATVPPEHASRILQRRGVVDASLIELDGTHESFTDMEQAMQHLRQFLDRTCRDDAVRANAPADH